MKQWEVTNEDWKGRRMDEAEEGITEGREEDRSTLVWRNPPRRACPPEFMMTLTMRAMCFIASSNSTRSMVALL